LHVHRLYNKEFGVKLRKVPAHMPHLLHKEILQDLQNKYVIDILCPRLGVE